jgi:hypothetical protein
VALSVHAVVVAIGDMLAEADAQRRTAHLPVETRGQAVRLLLDLAAAERPAPPEGVRGVSDLWPERLVDHCRPVAGPLSDLLERAKPPGALRNALSVSERLEEALRQVDRAAVALERRIDMAAFYRSEHRRACGPSESERARAVLAAMGVKS